MFKRKYLIYSTYFMLMRGSQNTDVNKGTVLTRFYQYTLWYLLNKLCRIFNLNKCVQCLNLNDCEVMLHYNVNINVLRMTRLQNLLHCIMMVLSLQPWTVKFLYYEKRSLLLFQRFLFFGKPKIAAFKTLYSFSS